MSGPVNPLPQIEAALEGELAEVDRILAKIVGSRLQLIEGANRYIHRSGGKRLRPMIVVLAAKAVGGDSRRAALYGSVVEMCHTATLVHDDIVDQADTRRGKDSLNHMLGDDLTVLIGDYLYIRSIAMAADAGDLRIVGMVCDLTKRMIEGMLLEMMRGGAIGLTREEHLRILQLKTAYLFQGCGRIGAVVGGADAATENALGDYGMNLGMAFQVADDLFDFTARAADVGKPVLSDLKDGHLTLPVLHALEREPESAGLVEEVVGSGKLDDDDAGRILHLVERTGGLAEARRVAAEYARAAGDSLAAIPPSPFRDALAAVAEYVVARDR